MPRIVDHTSSWLDRLRSEQREFMQRIGLHYTTEVKRLMAESPRSGREYRRGRKVHKASAPGEPPAVDRGRLIRSVGFRVVFLNKEWGVQVGSSLKNIPSWLEYGTRKMAPRPAWRPAVRNITPQIKREVEAIFKKRRGQ